MKKIIPTLLLCAFANWSYSAEYEVTADGWDNYGSILKFGVTERNGKVNVKYLEQIASRMVGRQGSRDEFREHEIQVKVLPQVIEFLKKAISEQAMPSNNVQYRLNSIRRDWVKYNFSSERLCFDQNSNVSVSLPWGDSAKNNWRALVDEKIGISNATGGPYWIFGFSLALGEKDGADYCVKVKDPDTAKMLKFKMTEFRSSSPVSVIIDSKVIERDVHNAYGQITFIARTKPVHVKFVTASNGVLYETDDVIAVSRY